MLVTRGYCRQSSMFGNAEKDVVERHLSAVKRRIDLDTPNPNGDTRMFQAALRGRVPEIKNLVRLGSKAIDTPDNNGCTPMYAAAKNGHSSAIELLVRLGSKAIDTPDRYGSTPMHAASSNGHVSAIEALVRLGSNAIDTPNWHNETPLGAALFRDQMACVKTLKALGADTNIPSDMFSAVKIEQLFAKVDEDEAMEVRYRVYFAESLVQRLLFSNCGSSDSSRLISSPRSFPDRQLCGSDRKQK